MSLKAIGPFRAGPEDVVSKPDETAPPDIVVEEDEDLAGAIESWFEKGEEYDRRYGDVDSHAG